MKTEVDVWIERILPWVGDPSRTARAEALIAYYNRVLSESAIVGKRPKTATLKQIKLFFGVMMFCAQNDVDEEVWIYTVFSQLGMKRPPSDAMFFQTKRLAAVETLSARGYESAVAIGASAEKTVDAFKPFRDLSIGGEHAKRSYMARGGYELCMANVDVTYGFHPASPICAGCHGREKCCDFTSKLARENA